jgi:hypothetical protein
MKKRTLLISIFAVVFLSSFIFALEVCNDGDNNCKINNGYSCLNEKVDARGCSSLSSGEKIFTALATGDCKSDLKSDSDFKSNLKYTAQAVLALNGDSEGEEWLLAQRSTPSQINWLLQIDTTNPSGTSCTINGNSVTLDENKKFSSSVGTCLSLYGEGYWLEINPACYSQTFQISCDQSFSTNLLYKKSNSETIYVLEDTHGSDANSPTSEKVNSSCFRQGTSCNYEGSLWATLALDSFNYDISSYMPYLITLADEDANKVFLPEAFLYLLTDDFLIELLSKQKNSKWWSESADRFYDTALAMYALTSIEPTQKESAKNWLLNEVQDADGCWNNGNLRNTAFILYSLEPRAATTGGGTATCVSAGNSCMTSISCSEAGGEALPYSCSGTLVCCSEEKLLKTCSEQGGNVCSSDQNCVGGTQLPSSGLSTGQVCCSGGRCEIPSSQVSECESSGGTCRPSGCLEEEQDSGSSCQYRTDFCCVEKKKGLGAFWIIFLLLLIILAVMGIIYKDKLRKLWFRFKSKFFPSSSSGKPFFGGRPFPPSGSSRRPIPRRVIPAPIQAPNPRMMRNVRPRKDVDDVLKRLKEMGK